MEAGLRTTLRPVRDQIQDPDPGPDPGPDIPDPGSQIPDISDLNNILDLSVKRPYEPINLYYSIISLNLASGWLLGGYPVYYPSQYPTAAPPRVHPSPPTRYELAGYTPRAPVKYGRGAQIRSPTHLRSTLVAY